MDERNGDRVDRMLSQTMSPSDSHTAIYELWREALAREDLDLTERLAEVSHALRAASHTGAPRAIG